MRVDIDQVLRKPDVSRDLERPLPSIADPGREAGEDEA